MSISRYERYKDSGVAWLGEVPTHWDTSRLRILVEIKKRIAGELGHDILSITQQGIRIKDTESNEGQLALDYSKYQLVEPGDFAMNHMDLLTGFVDIALMHGVTSPDYRVFSLRCGIVFDKRYLLYVFQNAYRRRIFYAFGQGSSHLGRWRLPTEQFNDFVVPFPAKDEQKQIAAFLDRETAKIDALIEEQQKLIAVLKEKRQAVISHTVTKGLNPSAKMKDSGVEWIGQVPKHWSILSLHYQLKEVFNGLTADQVDEDDQTVPVTRIETISKGVIDFDRVGYISIQDARPDRLLVDGDILFSNINSLSMVGNCAQYENGRVLYAGMNLLVLRPADTVNHRWLFWLVRSSVFRQEVESLSKPAINQASISQSSLCAIRIATPSLEEQRSIASFIDTEARKADGLITESEYVTKLLQERRSALISAAVTGKIDVRGLAANTSEVPEAAYEPA